MGVVQSGTASRPATTVSPQDYMYKSHRFLWSSESANCITASSGCRATRRSAFRGGDALETVSAWRRPGPGRPTQTRAAPRAHRPAHGLATLASGIVLISDARIRSRSAADGDPVDIISTQFTLCLQPRAPDFIYFSNPFHVGISHNTAYTTSFLNYGGQA